MNKKSGSRSAFFSPRFLITLAFCIVAGLLALVAFAIYPGGNAIAKQNEPVATSTLQQGINGVPVFEAITPSQEEEAPVPAPDLTAAVPLQPQGHIDMAALGIRPLPYPAIPKAWQNPGPDSAAAGSTGVYMQTSNDIVNQSTVAAFSSLSTGWQAGETVAFSLNGGAPTNFTANSFGAGTPLVYLGITISTGSGFGYITIDAVGNGSGRRAGAVVQVAPTGPYLPGVAAAPHAENTGGTSPQILEFGTGYPINSTITRYRNGVVAGTSAVGSLGTFFIATAALANNGNTSSVFSADTTAVAGSMNGSAEEERTDAGGPQAGDANTTRAFVDRAVINNSGASVAFSGEGFNAGETVNITVCAAGSVTANADGAANFFLTIPAQTSGTVTQCVMTGATSAKVGRASVLAHSNATNRRGLIVSPSSGNNVGNVTVLASKLPPNDTAFVYLDGVQVGSAVSNSAGIASLSIAKPSATGTHEVGFINTSGTGDAQATVYLVVSTTGPTPTPSPTPTPTVTPVGCQVLYNQTDMPGTNATNSQDFETANDTFDNQAADDFVVPVGPNWTVQTVFASGAYFNGNPAPGGPMPLVNLYFYTDSGGFPGTAIGTFLNTTVLSDSAGSIQVVVPGGGIVLTPGTYWVSVQARMDFGAPTLGQWGWTDRITTSNNAAAWQNPGGGFATLCSTWGRRGATCAIDSAAPDQIFRLHGCMTGGTVNISGRVGNCASPAPTATPPATPTPPTIPPVPNVLMTLSGSSAGTALTDASGNYSFTVNIGGNYTVTPSKTAIPPGSAGINTVDVLAVQRHFLGVTLIPAGCRQLAADVVVNGTINTQDVLALQRFFNGFTSGTGSCGQYRFMPANRSYSTIATNQTGQDYLMYIIGDVAAPFLNRPDEVQPDIPSTVGSVMLPEVSIDQSKSDLTPAVKASAIDGRDNIVGFQGDFTFDERVVNFASEPVQAAGLTANNWQVAGNVLPGNGPIRTVRVSAYSTDFVPLNGVGTLFNLRIAHVNGGAGSSPLTWAAPPDNFIFINADLESQHPGNASPGNIRSGTGQR